MCNDGDGRTHSKETRARDQEKRTAERYAKALKGLNARDEPITDVGLKRMKLQRLASDYSQSPRLLHQFLRTRWPRGLDLSEYHRRGVDR